MKPIEVKIKHRGYELRGFKSFVFYKSIKSLCSMFSLNIPAYKDADFSPEDDIKIYFNNHLIFTGHIEVLKEKSSLTEDSLFISGRNSLSSLVESTAENYREYNNITLHGIASKICEPFEISVNPTDSTDVIFDKYCISIGETCFKTLAKAARKAGGIFFSNSEGQLVFEKIGEKRIECVLTDKHVLSRVRNRDATYLHSDITVKSQCSIGNIEEKVKGASKRYRPLTILESANSKKQLEIIGLWENLNRLQISDKREITVGSWEYRSGDFWDLNRVIKIDTEKDKGKFLITDLIFTLLPEGYRTAIGLENITNYRI